MLDNLLGADFFETNTPLTRIEFQLHRCVLKDFGINSVQDLLEHETSIALYCSRKYFRILQEPKKQGHSSDQVTSEIWLQVQSRFLEVFPSFIIFASIPVLFGDMEDWISDFGDWFQKFFMPEFQNA